MVKRLTDTTTRTSSSQADGSADWPRAGTEARGKGALGMHAPLGYTVIYSTQSGGEPMGYRYTTDMLISDILKSNRAAAEVFARHGLSCPSCLAADVETLSAVAHMHDVDPRVLIAELEELPDASTEEGR